MASPAAKRARLEEKECTKCLETKPLTEFQKSKQILSGYGPKCKECFNEYARQREAKKQGDDFLYGLLAQSKTSSKKRIERVLKNTLTSGHFQELAKLHRVDYKNNTMRCAKSGHIIHMQRSSDFQVRLLFIYHNISLFYPSHAFPST
jgi:hypothetical protein